MALAGPPRLRCKLCVDYPCPKSSGRLEARPGCNLAALGRILKMGESETPGRTTLKRQTISAGFNSRRALHEFDAHPGSFLFRLLLLRLPLLRTDLRASRRATAGLI